MSALGQKQTSGTCWRHSAALNKWSWTANVSYGFDRIRRFDQTFSLPPQDRRSDVPRLFDHFGARHWITQRTTHGGDALRKAASVGQFDLNDGNAHRQELGKFFVVHEVYFRALPSFVRHVEGSTYLCSNCREPINWRGNYQT
jgi:hypothetical protein